MISWMHTCYTRSFGSGVLRAYLWGMKGTRARAPVVKFNSPDASVAMAEKQVIE